MVLGKTYLAIKASILATSAALFAYFLNWCGHPVMGELGRLLYDAGHYLFFGKPNKVVYWLFVVPHRSQMENYFYKIGLGAIESLFIGWMLAMFAIFERVVARFHPSPSSHAAAQVKKTLSESASVHPIPSGVRHASISNPKSIAQASAKHRRSLSDPAFTPSYAHNIDAKNFKIASSSGGRKSELKKPSEEGKSPTP